jgi:hypothetical protein
MTATPNQTLNGAESTNPPSPTVAIRVKQNGNASAPTTAAPMVAQPLNVHSLERAFSLLLGVGLIIWLGRRLFSVIALTGLAGFLIYRGVRGYCPLYQVARINTAEGTLGGFDGQATPTGEDPLQRELRHERQRDFVDEQSWESFPASDPPSSSLT